MTTSPARTEWRSLGVVVGIGFFGLVAQALLFRSFLCIFEGSELGIACFFASWLAWVALGALAARPWRQLTHRLTRRFELLPLLYIPAFLLQVWLIGSARTSAGIHTYELLPLSTMIRLSFWCNAPVSFCTGFLFTGGCYWLTSRHRAPVSAVYTWESIGSAVGGGWVTIALAWGLSSEQAFVWAALVLVLTVVVYAFRSRRLLLAALLAMSAAAPLLWGLARRWEQAGNLATWSRFLPAASFQGTFTTPNAKYLYGVYEGQFNVVAWDGIADTIPDTEHASEVIAIHLAQQPSARRFLVIGQGMYAVCSRLLALPQVERVVWLDPDPHYPALLLNRLPAVLAAPAARLEIPAGDCRQWLTDDRSPFDVAIVSFPSPTSLTLNRYFTREFFLLLKSRLAEAGIVGVRVAAGENYMSSNLANVGASVYHTLRTLFDHLAIKPGEESWLMASERQSLTNAPAVLQARFAAIPNAARLYPPAALLSLHLPQRIAYQQETYEQTASGSARDLLLNTDRRPRALLHGIIQSAHEAGGTVLNADAIATFALWGRPVLPAGLLLLLFLRLWRARTGRSADVTASGPGCLSRTDSYLLVLTTGAVGMGTSTLLMYLYQSVFGSLFLHIGLIAALSMLGMSLGSLAMTSLVARTRRFPGSVLPSLLGAHAAFCAVAALLVPHASHPAILAAIFVSGLLSGIYVPIASAHLQATGLATDTIGAVIETLDHLGGAIGGLLMGLVILPVFGTHYGLLILVLALLTNAAAFCPRREGRQAEPAAPPAPWVGALRSAGLGLVLFVLAAGYCLHRGASNVWQSAFLAFAQSQAAGHPLQNREAPLPGGGTLPYVVVSDTNADGTTGARSYLFTTEALAPRSAGYGGRLALALHVSADGEVRGLHVLPSHETPAYLAYIAPWLDRLCGRSIFGPRVLHDVDAVTGATITSAAILRILRQAGPAFARDVLGQPLSSAEPPPAAPLPYRSAVWLVATMLAVGLLRRRPARTRRQAFLMVMALVSGVVLNAQYSLTQVVALIGGAWPPPDWTVAFILTVGVPLLVLCLGNVYCGYLCPFGAIQELVGDLRRARARTDRNAPPWRQLLYLKYVVLGVLLFGFGVSWNHDAAACDPLVTAFAAHKAIWQWCAIGLWVVLAVAVPRFWCRCLCPTGAFLALLNRVQLVRRLVPRVVPQACPYGVEDRRQLDCLCCDRCRTAGYRAAATGREPAPAQPLRSRRIAIAIAWAGAIGILAQAGSMLWTGFIEHQALHRTTGTGMRTADLPVLRQAIREGRLSDQEARYYKAHPRAAP